MRVLSWIPERMLVAALPAGLRFQSNEVPKPVVAPKTPIRLFIGPVNSAGQGWQWARAAERNIASVGAVSMMRMLGDFFAFPVDYAVSVGVYQWSKSWQRAQRAAIEQQFSHVIFESAKHLFGDVLPGSVATEIETLQRAGLKVAVLCHGSDIRLPSRHAASNEWSPFAPGRWSATPVLETVAAKNAQLLDSIDLPVFVSTPDLLLDRPDAVWLPVVVDPDRWASNTAPFSTGRMPRVAHAPSKAMVKGSELIDPVLHRLQDEGLLEYVRIDGVPSGEMPQLYRGVDIVLDQFRLGSYGVAACEAMAAGRVVVSHVNEQVRDFVEGQTGFELPIVEATANSLEEILREIIGRPGAFEAIARSGPEFVREVHSGGRSADSMREFLKSV